MAEQAKPVSKTNSPVANSLPPAISFQSVLEEDKVADAHKSRMVQVTAKKKGIRATRHIPWFTANASTSYDAFLSELKALTAPDGAWSKLDNEGLLTANVAGEAISKKMPYKVCGKHPFSPAQLVAALNRYIGIAHTSGPDGMMQRLESAYGKPEVAAPAKQRSSTERKFEEDSII